MYVASPAFATWTGAEGPEGGGFDPIGPWDFFSTMMKPTWGWFIDVLSIVLGLNGIIGNIK